MNLRTTLILFGLLAAALGVFGLFQLFGVKTAAERTEGGKYVFASLNDSRKPIRADDFETLTIERENPETKQPEKLEFRRENAQWKMTAPKAVRTDSATVSALANEIMSLQKEKMKLKDDFAGYGLDKPALVVRLGKGSDAWKLNVGKEGPKAADPVYFVSASDDPKTPLAVRKSRIEKLFAPLADFRDKKIFTSSFGVTELSLGGKERPKLTLAKKGDAQWQFKEPALGDADASSVGSLNLDLTNLKVEKNSDFVNDAKPDAETLKKRGLTPEEAAYVVAITQTQVGAPDKLITETLLVGVIDPSAKAAEIAERAGPLPATLMGLSGSGLLALGPIASQIEDKSKPEAAAGARYAMKVGEDTIFRLSDKQLAPLSKSANDFRARTLLALDATKIDAINLTAGGETLKLRRQTLKSDASTPADWLLFTDSRAKVNAQNNQTQKLIDALNRVAAKDGSAFLDDEASQKKWFGTDPVDLGLDKPRAEIQLWLEGLERGADGKLPADKEPALKEAVKAKPAAKVFIGRRDPKRGVVYVRKDIPDQKSVMLALPDPWTQQPPAPGGFQPEGDSRQSFSLSELAEAGYLAYRDRSLPSLATFNAAKLDVVRPNEALELKRSEEKDEKGAMVPSWKIVKPFEAKSPLADVLVNGLTSMGAEKLVTDRPTDRDLEEKFGLGAKPFLKFILTGKPDANNKADEYTYLIGKKTEADGKHPDHYYARLIAKPASGAPPDSNQFVFVVPKAMMPMLDAELRDTIVFPHEASQKPQSLTLTWRSVDATKKLSETKLELGLAEDKKTWVVKSLTTDGKDEKATLPKLDQGKIAALVGAADPRMAPLARGGGLNPLMTGRFIVQQGAPTPAMKLDPASKEAPARLVIEAKFDGGATRTLTLGETFEPKETEYPALAGRQFYYATASGVPNAVFVVPQAAFKDLSAGPQFLKAAETVSSAAP